MGSGGLPSHRVIVISLLGPDGPAPELVSRDQLHHEHGSRVQDGSSQGKTGRTGKDHGENQL